MTQDMKEQHDILYPDPSTLTTNQLQREIASLKELFETRMSAVEGGITIAHDDVTRVPTEVQKQVGYLKELVDQKFQSVNDRCDEIVAENILRHSAVDTRFDGNDKAIELLQSIADKFPARMDEKIQSLAGIHEEKFTSIGVQFKERDVRSEQSSKDSKVAVDAALQAAKEAVGEQNKSSALAIAKSETSTVKQIDQLGLLIQTGNKATDDKINDLKDRMTRIEGQHQGTATARTEVRDVTSGKTASIGLIMAIIFGASGLFVALTTLLVMIMKR